MRRTTQGLGLRSPRLNADPKLAAVAYDPLHAEWVTGKGTFVRTSLSKQAHYSKARWRK
jgi:hypothetical protein